MSLEKCVHMPDSLCPHKTTNCDKEGMKCIHVINSHKVGDIHDQFEKFYEIIRGLEESDKRFKKFIAGRKEFIPL